MCVCFVVDFEKKDEINKRDCVCMSSVLNKLHLIDTNTISTCWQLDYTSLVSDWLRSMCNTKRMYIFQFSVFRHLIALNVHRGRNGSIKNCWNVRSAESNESEVGVGCGGVGEERSGMGFEITLLRWQSLHINAFSSYTIKCTNCQSKEKHIDNSLFRSCT